MGTTCTGSSTLTLAGRKNGALEVLRFKSQVSSRARGPPSFSMHGLKAKCCHKRETEHWFRKHDSITVRKLASEN